jgi:hypothetical protein
MSHRHPVPLASPLVRDLGVCTVFLVFAATALTLLVLRPPWQECLVCLPVFVITGGTIWGLHRCVGQQASAVVKADAAGSSLLLSHDDKAVHTPQPKQASRRKAS